MGRFIAAGADSDSSILFVIRKRSCIVINFKDSINPISGSMFEMV